MFEAADSGVKDINFDLCRWQQIVEDLILHEDLLRSFEKAFCNELHSERTQKDVHYTSMNMKEPSQEEIRKMAQLLRENANLFGKSPEVGFRQSKFKFSEELHRFMFRKFEEYRRSF